MDVAFLLLNFIYYRSTYMVGDSRYILHSSDTNSL